MPVEGGLVDGAEGAGKLLLEVLLGEHDRVWWLADGLGHLPGKRRSSYGNHLESDRERVHIAGAGAALASAATELESIPPERKTPRGTSEISCIPRSS